MKRFTLWTLCIVVSLAVVACARSPSKEQANNNAQSNDQGAKKPVTPPPTTDDKQPSQLDKVSQWAGPDATVSPYEEVAVPGMELFTVLPGPPAGVVQHDYTPPRRGVVVQAGHILEGKDAMRAAMDAGVSAPEDTARLALLFLHTGGNLVTSGEGAHAPGFQGRAFVYFWRTNDMGRQLMKSTLDMGALEVETEPGVAQKDPVDEARETLASGSKAVWRTALVQLQSLCTSDPKALGLLLDTARTHTDATTRGEAAKAAGACSSADAIAPLGEILQKDPDESVRAAAAAGLGAVGGQPATDALKAAQAGEKSQAVRRAIVFALKQIKRATP